MASESNGLDLSSDVVLQSLVDSYKSKRMERTSSQLTRQKEGRVYVNRSISMDKIKYIGFDMDHTLVVYKSPEYDILAYEMVVERLVSIGYPQEIQNIPYDSTFPVRGLFFDRYSGNLLKVDAFGNIMSAFHGFRSLSARKIREMYPNKYIQTSHERVFPLDTLFHIPETYLLATVVDFFDSNTAYRKLVSGPDYDMGVVCGDVTITYKMIQQDIRAAMHWVHTEGNLKQRTLNDLPRYVKKEPRLPLFLHRLRESGRKLFIATNSGYDYTQKVLSFMFDYPEDLVPHQHWKNYFDYIIVDANKPLFFQEGTMLREVDEESGSLKLGMFTGGLKQGKIFSGGSSAAFCKYTGAKGKEVLYVGDHIFGDIIKSKKEQAFRTFLVIPELTSEIDSWEEHSGLFLRLQNLEFILAEMYHLDSESNGESQRESLPDIATIRMAMKETAQRIEESYPNQLGSLLRCGSRLTYFANQVSRFADLYSSACINLVNYPTNHLFSSPHQLMAHETPLCESVPLTPHSVNQLSRTPKRKVVGKLAQGLSVVDFDVDEEENDSTGSKVPLAIVEEGQMDA